MYKVVATRFLFVRVVDDDDDDGEDDAAAAAGVCWRSR